MASAEKVSKGILMLKAQGRLIAPHMKFDKLYWEVDFRIRATGEDVACLADGVYSFSEFEEVCIKRGAQVASRSFEPPSETP